MTARTLARCAIAAGVVLAALQPAFATEAREASPRIVGDGRISRAASHESPCAIDGEGRLWFSRATADFSASEVLVGKPESTGEPARAPISTSSYDAGCNPSPRGDGLLFTSKRPTGDPRLPDEWNVWIAKDGESEPSPLPPPVNSKASECCAVWVPDGTFLFSSNRDGSWDVFRARREGAAGWSVARLAGSINGAHDEWPSWVSPGADLILFSSIRPGGPGGDDVFAACRANGDADAWNAVRLPPPVNSSAYEDGALVTPDGRRLVWSSWRPRPTGEALGDVYELEIEAAGVPPCGT